MEDKKLTVSVIVPARDEAGMIASIPKLIPLMGKKTELIFVEGNSTDCTWEEIKKAKDQKVKIDIRAYRQGARKGKFGAVQVGFKQANGDILIILDSDLSVSPQDLPKFYDQLASGMAEFVNGARLVGPVNRKAMPLKNYLANLLFARVFSFILGQRVTDTLCGTKAFFKKDYEKILEEADEIGKKDPFGDFTLLVGASKLGLRIVEVPVRYRERTYGKSKIVSYRNALKLLYLLGKSVRVILFEKNSFKNKPIPT